MWLFTGSRSSALRQFIEIQIRSWTPFESLMWGHDLSLSAVVSGAALCWWKDAAKTNPLHLCEHCRKTHQCRVATNSYCSAVLCESRHLARHAHLNLNWTTDSSRPVHRVKALNCRVSSSATQTPAFLLVWHLDRDAWIIYTFQLWSRTSLLPDRNETSLVVFVDPARKRQWRQQRAALGADRASTLNSGGGNKFPLVYSADAGRRRE